MQREAGSLGVARVSGSPSTGLATTLLDVILHESRAGEVPSQENEAHFKEKRREPDALEGDLGDEFGLVRVRVGQHDCCAGDADCESTMVRGCMVHRTCAR